MLEMKTRRPQSPIRKMSENFSLSEDQMEKLLEGEKVQFPKDHGAGVVKIYPPCSKYGHEWGYYRHDDHDGFELTRRCTRCGTEETQEIDPEEIFGDDQ
jgi:ribosomal protein S14